MNTMPVAKRNAWNYGDLLLGAGEDMESLKVLDANVAHVQRDVAEIKVDQRRAADKLDAMNGRLDALRDKIDDVGADMKQRIDDVSARKPERTLRPSWLGFVPISPIKWPRCARTSPRWWAIRAKN